MSFYYIEDNKGTILKKVYDQLQDDLSRKIYISRSLYSLTDEPQYMREIVRTSVLGKLLLDGVNTTKKKIALFGAGIWGHSIATYFPDINIDCFVDNKKCGQTIHGLPVYSVGDLRPKLKEYYIVISILYNCKPVVMQLQNEGVSDQNMLVLGDLAREHQYFDLNDLPHRSGEIFVDCGGFRGESSEQFIKWSGGDYEKVYLFEPDKKLIKECRENLSIITDSQRIQYYECGLWNENTILSFQRDKDAARSRTIQNEDISGDKINVRSIDSIVNDHNATFIKMDIEGSELQALQGAVNTIKKSRPKLAISVYHKRNDIWDIPMFLLGIHPDYKFYLRTYSFTGNDTVLYAI